MPSSDLPRSFPFRDLVDSLFIVMPKRGHGNEVNYIGGCSYLQVLYKLCMSCYTEQTDRIGTVILLFVLQWCLEGMELTWSLHCARHCADNERV